MYHILGPYKPAGLWSIFIRSNRVSKLFNRSNHKSPDHHSEADNRRNSNFQNNIVYALSDNCNRDYVEVHSESASGPLLGHFCGSAVPSNVTVGNKLWIKFRSDERGTTGGGFIAEYNLREYRDRFVLIRKL